MQAHWTTESATDGGWSGQGSLAQNARGAFFSAKKALEGAFNRRTTLRASLLEVWNVDIRQALRICEGMLGVRFPRPLMSTRLWRAFCRGFAKVIAVWTACHTAVAISASLGETAFLNCCFSAVKTSRSLDSSSVVVLLQRLHHLHKFFNCRSLVLYRRSRELQFLHFAAL